MRSTGLSRKLLYILAHWRTCLHQRCSAFPLPCTSISKRDTCILLTTAFVLRLRCVFLVVASPSSSVMPVPYWQPRYFEFASLALSSPPPRVMAVALFRVCFIFLLPYLFPHQVMSLPYWQPRYFETVLFSLQWLLPLLEPWQQAIDVRVISWLYRVFLAVPPPTSTALRHLHPRYFIALPLLSLSAAFKRDVCNQLHYFVVVLCFLALAPSLLYRDLQALPSWMHNVISFSFFPLDTGSFIWLLIPVCSWRYWLRHCC
jgi:hypothetical protein